MTDPTDVPPAEYDNYPDAYNKAELDAGTLLVNGVATGSATTVFVVNEIADDKVAPTGIFIDNLPYILMVGIPVAVFGVMFANRLRKNSAA
jgi:predicted aconitase with swiveling domain